MRLSPSYSTSSLFSMACSSAEIQLVATSRDVLLDLQTQSRGVDGRSRRSHATCALPLQSAVALEMLLGDAISASLAASDARQMVMALDDDEPELSDISHCASSFGCRA